MTRADPEFPNDQCYVFDNGPVASLARLFSNICAHSSMVTIFTRPLHSGLVSKTFLRGLPFAQDSHGHSLLSSPSICTTNHPRPIPPIPNRTAHPVSYPCPLTAVQGYPFRRGKIHKRRWRSPHQRWPIHRVHGREGYACSGWARSLLGVVDP